MAMMEHVCNTGHVAYAVAHDAAGIQSQRSPGRERKPVGGSSAAKEPPALGL